MGYEECCLLILKSNKRSAFQRDTNGLMPIHYAVMAGHANLISLFFEYYDEYVKCSEESPASQKLVDKEGFSLLHYACFNGHSTCAETLCDLGTNAYTFLTEMLIEPSTLNDYNSFSVLHAACKNSHDACVSFLLDKFSSQSTRLVELEDGNGNRPLHVCALSNECDCALLLLEAHCDINAKNKLEKTPLMLAASSNSFNLMELLLAKGIPLMKAIISILCHYIDFNLFHLIVSLKNFWEIFYKYIIGRSIKNFCTLTYFRFFFQFSPHSPYFS